MDFKTLPKGPVSLTNLTAPACLIGQPGDLVGLTLHLDGGQISDSAKGPEIDMAGAMVFPAFVDMHTHLDKGHIWNRAPNPNGTFLAARDTVMADREANWSAEDVRARMSFALRSAYAHGTRAIRTHLDSAAPQDGISIPVFKDLRSEWAGKVDLQASCLMGISMVEEDGPFAHTADLMKDCGGTLGAVAYPSPDTDDKLRSLFRMAEARELAVDLHVDETMEASVKVLRSIAQIVREMRFEAPVTVGHCCSLLVQDEAEALATVDLVAQAGLSVVSLPMCNLYLQDRYPGRSPRYRGATLVHEMAARGIPVSFASDNTRDPFYAYGDLDMLEVMREATRICHLDHSRKDWSKAFTTTPAQACGFDVPSLAAGAKADLVICKARNWSELFSRPQSDRIVLRDGVQIDRTLPDYAELDALMGAS
jgi:cytosine deaminase